MVCPIFPDIYVFWGRYKVSHEQDLRFVLMNNKYIYMNVLYDWKILLTESNVWLILLQLRYKIKEANAGAIRIGQHRTEQRDGPGHSSSAVLQLVTHDPDRSCDTSSYYLSSHTRWRWGDSTHSLGELDSTHSLGEFTYKYDCVSNIFLLVF